MSCNHTTRTGTAPAYLGMGYFNSDRDRPDLLPSTRSFPGPVALYCMCRTMIASSEAEDVESGREPPVIWLRDQASITHAENAAGETGSPERFAPGEYVSLQDGD